MYQTAIYEVNNNLSLTVILTKTDAEHTALCEALEN
jgi:hypothetical protein